MYTDNIKIINLMLKIINIGNIIIIVIYKFNNVIGTNRTVRYYL